MEKVEHLAKKFKINKKYPGFNDMISYENREKNTIVKFYLVVFYDVLYYK